MRNLGIILPNETPERAFALGCDMVSEELMLSSAAAVTDMLGALLGYTTRTYEKTFAIRQFSEGLAGRVYDGYNRGNRGKGVGRVNAYLGGGATRDRASEM